MATDNGRKPLLLPTQYIFPMYPFKHGLDVWRTSSNDIYAFSDNDIDILERTVGFPPVLPDVRAFLKRYCNVEDPINYSWPDILAALKLNDNDQTKAATGGGDTPKDSISLLVAVNEFEVSRPTLKRAIKDGTLISYRKNDKGLHRVSRAELERNYKKRP